MLKLEVLRQSQDLRQVPHLEWVMVGGEMSLFLKPDLEDQTLATSEVFVICISRKTLLNEVLKWIA